MAGKPIATIGSMHMCPMCSGSVPHVGGPITGPGAPNVLINSKPVALIGDMCTCIGPPDVVAQGHPLVKVNGVSVVCQGDLTAHGGMITSGEPTVMISTAVPSPSQTMPKEKIPFPKITFVNRAIAAFTGNSLSEAEANQDALANQAEETPVSEDSEEVALTTTYPQEQLQHLAANTTLHQFLYNFIAIFGKDIPSKAYEELFKDAKENASILTPTLVVKKTVPYGGKALFYNNKREDIQEIWVGEAFVREAAENNDTRGELMVALVEEFGHWLDYLLRNKYAETERNDAMRDEGAYFSYRLLQLNSIDKKDQYYADATIAGAAHQLTWDYESYHKGLKAYVGEERWNKDDHFGPFEFYKAGFLKEDEGEYSHGNIELIGLSQSLLDSELSDKLGHKGDPLKIKEYLINIYFGNWKRDFSQGLDPLVIRLLANALKAFADQSDLPEESTYDDSLKRFSFNRLKTDTVTENEEVTYKFGLLGLNFVEKTFKPVEVSVKMISTMLEMLAAKEFIYTPMVEAGYNGNINYNQYLLKLKEEFSAINKDEMGVYIPAEHIDNPKGVGTKLEITEADGSVTKKDNDDKAIMPEFIGIDAQKKSLHKINTAFGMKNYIRNENTGAGKRAFKNSELPNRYLYSHTYILDKLKEASKNGGYKNKACKDSLGAALHTLEDYFAHSNYAELALIKEGAYGVFPWVTQVEFNEIDKSAKKKKGVDYLKYIKDHSYRVKVNNAPSTYDVVENAIGINRNNQLVTKIPLVTGTFGLLDTVASLLPIVAHAFDYDVKTSKRDLEKQREAAKKEEHGHFYYTDNINSRAFPEVLGLELLRDIANDTEGEDHIVVKGFLKALAARDGIYKGLDEMSEKAHSIYDEYVPDDTKRWIEEEAAPKAKKVTDKISKKKTDIVDGIMAPIYKVLYSFITMIAANINDIQVLQQADIKKLLEESKKGIWDLGIGMNPSHTQVAKDDPHHPMHGLSAVLAIEAVQRIGTKVFNTWQGKGTFIDVEKELNAIMKHPAQTNWQSGIVKKWMRGTSKHKEGGKVSEISNRSLICEASSPSVAIGRLLHVNVEIKEILEDLEHVANQPRFKNINEVIEKMYTDSKDENKEVFETFESTLETIKSRIKSQDEALTELQNEWDKQFPESLYCRMDHPAILYQVQTGDTLGEIAIKGSTTIEDLLELNPFIDPDSMIIYAGTDIKVPNPIFNSPSSTILD